MLRWWLWVLLSWVIGVFLWLVVVGDVWYVRWVVSLLWVCRCVRVLRRRLGVYYGLRGIVSRLVKWGCFLLVWGLLCYVFSGIVLWVVVERWCSIVFWLLVIRCVLMVWVWLCFWNSLLFDRVLGWMWIILLCLVYVWICWVFVVIIVVRLLVLWRWVLWIVWGKCVGCV